MEFTIYRLDWEIVDGSEAGCINPPHHIPSSSIGAKPAPAVVMPFIRIGTAIDAGEGHNSFISR